MKDLAGFLKLVCLFTFIVTAILISILKADIKELTEQVKQYKDSTYYYKHKYDTEYDSTIVNKNILPLKQNKKYKLNY